MIIKYRHASDPKSVKYHDTDDIYRKLPDIFRSRKTSLTFAEQECQRFERDRKRGIILECEVIPSVYLLMQKNGTWSAELGYIPPSENHVRLIAEDVYPVTLYYKRYDLMGSAILDKRTCRTRKGLLDALEWCGNCRNTICQLWSYDIEENDSPELKRFWEELECHRARIVQAAAKDLQG